MPEIFINGQAVQAADNQSVLEAARASGHFIPYFCWHPKLSVAGNCRICVVQVEGRSWVEIACNMPVTEGLRVFTDSDLVHAHRKMVMQFLTLNHPVDCGICDKAGECKLQDFHYAYNGEPSTSHEPKVRATKFHDLSERIVLDNERCILCSRCVRFTHEISKSCALGIKHRGDESLVRASEDGALDRDPYSDNVIDICPVGALLSRPFLHKARVWYLQPTPSVCPGCARGCAVNIWHRKPAWHLKALDPKQNVSIARVTPLENPAVNGPWICNKGRDLARIFERPRAEEPMQKGKPVALAAAIDAARRLLASAKHPVALVSSWGSNEELAAFNSALGARVSAFVKTDCVAEQGEPVEDDLLIRADKNPNTAAARALFAPLPDPAAPAFGADTDLVLIWGEGFAFARLPAGAKIIYLNAYLQPENGHADVFFPVSIQTERAGHYTNFKGVVSAFEPCFAKKPAVVDAEAVFAALAAAPGGPGMTQDLVIYAVYIGYALAVLMGFGTVLTWVERKQAAVMSDRIGANRAYIRIPFTQYKMIWLGLFHGIADGIKMLLKEDWKPNSYDWYAYAVAPWVVFTPVLLVFAVIPFGGLLDPAKLFAGWPAVAEWFGGKTYPMQIAQLDAGLLIVFAFGGMSIIGAMLAGWSSSNKFSMLGALRAGSQMISYELIMGLTVLGLILIYGTVDLTTIVQQQSATLLGFLPAWGIFLQPFAATLFLAAAIAENKRIPFDLPEAESELIAGFYTEYSAMKMGLFMFAEFIEIAIVAALFTTLFLGGYNLPFMTDAGIVFAGNLVLPMSHGAVVVTQLVVFLVKVLAIASFQILIRWSLPRFRYDQVLMFAWKFMLPLTLVNLTVTAVLAWSNQG